jgi:hypothetical protein
MSKKHRYKIRNWNAYNRALINRGSLTLWIDEEAAHTQWCNHEKNGRRGRDLTYSDWAIQCVLTLKVLYRLPLRATQGLVASLLELMGLDLPTPSYTQICRRQATLTVAVPRRKAARARHIVIDATGLKVSGEGEWKVRQHGVSKRRTWRTLHLTVDAATQEIVASVLPENAVGECEVGDEMLGQLEADAPIEQADADGAYDTRRTYRAVSERGARVCLPPRELLGQGLLGQDVGRLPLLGLQQQGGTEVGDGAPQAHEPRNAPAHHQEQHQGPLQPLHGAQLQRLNTAAFLEHQEQQLNLPSAPGITRSAPRRP